VETKGKEGGERCGGEGRGRGGGRREVGKESCVGKNGKVRGRKGVGIGEWVGGERGREKKRRKGIGRGEEGEGKGEEEETGEKMGSKV